MDLKLTAIGRHGVGTLGSEGEGLAEGERSREKSSERLAAGREKSSERLAAGVLPWLGSGGVPVLPNGDGPAAAAAWLCASIAACRTHIH